MSLDGRYGVVTDAQPEPMLNLPKALPQPTLREQAEILAVVVRILATEDTNHDAPAERDGKVGYSAGRPKRRPTRAQRHSEAPRPFVRARSPQNDPWPGARGVPRRKSRRSVDVACPPTPVDLLVQS